MTATEIKRALADEPPLSEDEIRIELARQGNLLRNPFKHIELDAYLEPSVKVKRLAVVQQILSLIDDVHNGKAKPADFFAYQDAYIDDRDHNFLGDSYPGLNVVGWKVCMALMDPMQYGRTIRFSSDVHAPISMRSKK